MVLGISTSHDHMHDDDHDRDHEHTHGHHQDDDHLAHDNDHDDHEHGQGNHHHDGDWRELALCAAICGISGVIAIVLEQIGGVPAWLPVAFYIVALIAGAWDAAKDSWETIKTRTLDIHFLMLAVAVGAVCIGAWREAVLLLFLFSGAGAMEAYAMDRTQREVSSLLKTAPKTATLLDPDGTESTVQVETLAIGDRVRVRPGEAFPADGAVFNGESASDESTLTGEAAPVDKKNGSEVFSGTINLWGMLDFEVRRLPSESTLQKVIRLIQTAQKLRAPSERFTDKFGGRYTLVALGACALMFFVWWLGFGVPPFRSGETTSAFYRAMTLLVVMSPCALVLSIPSAILAAIAWGAKHGVLFRGGAAIEKLAEVTVIALDKTGTLTTGELTVSDIKSYPPGRERDVLRLAAALEANSMHPLARAIVRHAETEGVQPENVGQFESLTGMGLRGIVGGIPVLLGRRELLIENDGELGKMIETLPHSPPDQSEVWVSGDGVAGHILLRDQIRNTSRDTLRELRSTGVRTVMLTGDRRHAAETVARELGLDEVRSGLTPADKVAAIQSFREQGKRIAMVGDGVNDAPSLAAADVSIAMGARGSDAALEQAEVILMHDRIENVLAAFRLSRRAKRIIRENLAVSLGVVIVMATGSLFGIVPLWLGVIAHEGSSVVVCLNALRLLLGKNK